MKTKKVSRVVAFSLASAMSLTSVEMAGAEETKNYWEMLDSVSDTSELPDWTGDTLDVTLWVAGGTDVIFGSISDTNVTFKELERVTGVRFDVENSFGNNGDNIDAKIPKLVASKEFPTMVFGWDIDLQMRDLYEHGYLADLTKYYEDGSLDQLQYWIPTEVYGDTFYRSMHDEDGNYYLIPAQGGSIYSYYDASDYSPEEYDSEKYNSGMRTPVNVGGSRSSMVYIRDDILKALYPDALTAEEIENIYVETGTFTEDQIFDIPIESAEDFFNLLRDIKELLATGEYVGLDGKPLEVTYGPNADADNWCWMYDLPAYQNANMIGVDYFTVIDNNAEDVSSLITRGFMTESAVSFMRGLNALVNEDVISQNSLVDNRVTFDEKCVNGHYAVYYSDPSTPIRKLKAEDESWGYRQVYSKAELNRNYGGYADPGRASYFGIFKNSVSEEQLDQLIHCINYLQSKVGMKNFIWGPATAGLFEEDENGIRTYTDPELHAAMVENEDNDAPVKYGLLCSTVSESTFSHVPVGSASELMGYKWDHVGTQERKAEEAYLYYMPGSLKEWSKAENTKLLATDCKVYSFGVSNVEDLQEFWSARSGFENQMKKVIATTTDNFDKELENLLQYSIENGMTDEALQEFSQKFYEANKMYLTDIIAE